MVTFTSTVSMYELMNYESSVYAVIFGPRLLLGNPAVKFLSIVLVFVHFSDKHVLCLYKQKNVFVLCLLYLPV